jgi:hypothetical protein
MASKYSFDASGLLNLVENYKTTRWIDHKLRPIMKTISMRKWGSIF